jgi:hypothetical protein
VHRPVCLTKPRYLVGPYLKVADHGFAGTDTKMCFVAISGLPSCRDSKSRTGCHFAVTRKWESPDQAEHAHAWQSLRFLNARRSTVLPPIRYLVAYVFITARRPTVKEHPRFCSPLNFVVVRSLAWRSVSCLRSPARRHPGSARTISTSVP